MKNLKVMETATIKEVEEYALHYPLLIAIKGGEEWFFYGAAMSADHAAELIANRQKWGYAEMKVFNNPVLNGNQLILDCEWFRTGEVYDIGMSVIDKTGAIVFCRGWLINEAISAGGTEAEEILKSHASYSGGQYRRGSFKEVMHEVDNLMIEYGCQIPYAFNGWADIRAILRTAERYEVKTPFWMSTIEKDGSVWTQYGVYDILPEAKRLLQQQYAEKYHDWCQEFGFLTPSGKPSFSAEAIYSFLVRKANYREDHCGLDDSRDESLILHWLKCHDIVLPLRETKKK